MLKLAFQHEKFHKTGMVRLVFQHENSEKLECLLLITKCKRRRISRGPSHWLRNPRRAQYETLQK
jgi:hypothetical protein